jgi:hypothetical protein
MTANPARDAEANGRDRGGHCDSDDDEINADKPPGRNGFVVVTPPPARLPCVVWDLLIY